MILLLITYAADLLHLLEITFDRKRVSANLSTNPSPKPNPNLNPKAQQRLRTDEMTFF